MKTESKFKAKFLKYTIPTTAKILIKAKNIYKEFAELEYRLFGLFMIAEKEQYAYMHLKNALSIDYDGFSIINELFPTLLEKVSVQKIVAQYS